jgi:hypothetical protein
MQNGKVWKLAYVDGWDEELQWEQTEYDQLPVSYLRFNKLGDVLYSVSHGTLGYKAQKELNYLNELWKKHIDNIRNQVAIHGDAFTERGLKTLRNNDIGGVVEAKQPLTAGTYANLQSGSVDPQLFGNIQSVRLFLQLVMNTTGGKMGGPESELATTEKNKALGDVLRQSGMQDAIRDFYIDQIKQRIKNFLKFGTPDMVIKITGRNLINPATGQPMQFGTELPIGRNGFAITDLIKQGQIDVDFAFDVDMQSAVRPDLPVVRKQIGEGIVLATQLAPLLRNEGQKINFAEMLKDYYNTFDAIPDAGKYIEQMTPEEIQAMQQAQQQAQVMEMIEKGGKPVEEALTGTPSEESISRSVNPMSPAMGTGG